MPAPTYDIQITVTPAGLALGWHHMHHGGFARCLQGPYTDRSQYTPADLPTVLQALIMGILEAHVVAVTPCGGILHNTTPVRQARPWEVSLNWLYRTAPTPALGEQPPTPSMRAAVVRQCGTLNPTGTEKDLVYGAWRDAAARWGLRDADGKGPCLNYEAWLLACTDTELLDAYYRCRYHCM